MTQTHSQNIKQSNFEFKSLEEFEVWRHLENRDVDYASSHRTSDTSGIDRRYYDCNRSDIRGMLFALIICEVPKHIFIY